MAELRIAAEVRFLVVGAGSISYAGSGRAVAIAAKAVSNYTFERGSPSVVWVKPFDLLAARNENGDWLGVRDDFRNCSDGPEALERR